MSAVINTNIAAIRTHNTYNRNNDYMNQALTRVATGMKINSAKDGGSVWAISEKMRERIRANDQANQNVQNDTAMLKTAEGGVSNTIDILKTLKERAVNAANDSNMTVDRNILQVEVDQLINQINDNAAKVKFNGRTLLNGSAAADTGTAASSSVEVPATAATADTYSSAITLKANAGATGSDFITEEALLNKITNRTTASNGDAASFATGVSLVTDNDGTDTSFSNATKIKYDSTSGKWYYNQSSDDATVYVKTAGTAATAASTTTTTGTGTVPTSGNDLNFHIGGESDFTMTFTMESMTASALLNGSDSLVVTTVDDAKAAITAIDNALETALKFQTKLGAYENRLGYTSDNLTTMNENLEAADSTMRDADIAKEMTNYMKYSVLAQASQYMLAQAGQNAFSVLNLLQA